MRRMPEFLGDAHRGLQGIGELLHDGADVSDRIAAGHRRPSVENTSRWTSCPMAMPSM
jgi:hypothetical protein